MDKMNENNKSSQDQNLRFYFILFYFWFNTQFCQYGIMNAQVQANDFSYIKANIDNNTTS